MSRTIVNCEKIKTFFPWDLSFGRSLETRTIFPLACVSMSRALGISIAVAGFSSPLATASWAAFSAAASMALRFFAA